MARLPYLAVVLGMVLSGIAPDIPAQETKPLFVFSDVGRDSGLLPHVAGIAGHGAVWGDADGDGWPDLYVGTFGSKPYNSKPNQFFRNRQGKFEPDEQPQLQIVGRANGGVFADFDNDGDLDLYITNHAIQGRGDEQSHYAEPNHLFRNDGNGRFTDVSQASGACPTGLAARSATVLDFDGDGLLDLLVGECFFQGGKSRSKLFRNQGDFKFEDVTARIGLPEQATGFGVAAGDVNGDTWPDVFFAGRHHGNRLFLNDGKGRFREAKGNAVFVWENYDDGDDTTSGICFGDVNRDGLIDLAIGSHFGRPWQGEGVPVRLYLNRGVKGGEPTFEDITASAGLKPLPMKSPHVEIQDFDNDGWPDIYTSIVKFQGDKPHPVIFKNLGEQNSPRFAESALGVNDFPTAEDRAIRRTGDFFNKMIADRKILYTAPGPSADFDRDGRLDLFLANWWVESPSLLLRNETPAGNWLAVAVRGRDGMNRMGVGALVRVYTAGKLGKPEGLLGVKEIAAGYGYASGQEAIAHLGLGDAEACDVEVILPHGRGRIEKTNVAANQRIVME